MRTLQQSLRLLLFIFLLCLLLTPWPSAKAQQVQPSELFFNELQVIHLVNLERRAVGLGPLRWNRELTDSARGFVQDVIANQPIGFCGHIDSQGRSPGERIRAAGFFRLGAWAENAVCGYTTPAAAVRAWMNSESHRRNLLDARFREVGVGYALSSTNRGYIVVDLAVDPHYAPVIIENEAPSTTSRQVNLYIYDQATGGGFMGLGPAVEMMISNDPDFVGAVWQPYASETTWTLSEGDGWKVVYVKTRDALGRTAVVSDQIYLGATLPLEELSLTGACHFGSGFRLNRIDANGWPQIQFSLDWVGDDSDPNFIYSPNTVTRVDDAAAVGGTAMLLQHNGIVSIWTGGYLASNPAVAYFRVKVGDHRTDQHVVRLHVSDAQGAVSQLVLRGSDFREADSYQEFAVPYNLGSDAKTVTFRIDRLGAADVTFDAVTVFSTPVPVMAPLQWQSPENYLRSRGVQARFVKENGEFSAPVDVHPESGALTFTLTEPIEPAALTVSPSSVWLEAAPEEPTPVARLSVACTNCADGVWQATTDASWIELTLSDAGELEIRVIMENLSPGIHQGQVVITAPEGSGIEPFVVPVTVVVGEIENFLTEQVYLPAVLR